jgi:hypothetical protein
VANINHTLVALVGGVRPAMAVSEARRIWRAYRMANGWGPDAPILTPPDGNAKFLKDASVVTYGLALAQANTAGRGINVCPFSTPACRAGCVALGGMARFKGVLEARAMKTRFLADHPDAFLTLVEHELSRAAAKYGDRLRVRLNTFSDIRWEEVAPWILRTDVQFYDYTKDWARTPPANYRLTLSASERTSKRAIRSATVRGATVAVVFSTKRGHALPSAYAGMKVTDGDCSDNRADDGAGVVVGLRAKGRMRGDTRGMVRAV